MGALNNTKSPPSSWVFKAIVLALALAGWGMWAINRHAAVQINQTAQELEELNEFLLKDIGQFKHKYERIVRAGSFSGRGVSDFRLRQAIASLREENGALKKKLDEASATYERELKALQAAKTKQTPAPGDSAVNLGTLSVSPNEAVFQDTTGAKSAASPQTIPSPQMTRGARSKVLSVDEKEAFVIVDIGKNSGAFAGARYTVFKDSTEIARVEIVEARDLLSACIIEYAGDAKRLQTNDQITLVGDR